MPQFHDTLAEDGLLSSSCPFKILTRKTINTIIHTSTLNKKYKTESKVGERKSKDSEIKINQKKHISESASIFEQSKKGDVSTSVQNQNQNVSVSISESHMHKPHYWQHISSSCSTSSSSLSSSSFLDSTSSSSIKRKSAGREEKVGRWKDEEETEDLCTAKKGRYTQINGLYFFLSMICRYY